MLLSGVQVNSFPVAPEVRVETVFRLPEGPLLRRMVTGPEAPSQVSLKGLPASTLKSVLVNEALAATMAANSTGVMKNCILAVLLFGSRKSVEKKMKVAVEGALVLEMCMVESGNDSY
jgi:hypothetical protein